MSAGGNIHFTKLFAIVILHSFFIKLTVPMRFNRHHSRSLYAALIITAFFIPAYNSDSAFRFLTMAIGSLSTDAEVTVLDLLVVILPLLLIPVACGMILFRSLKKMPVNTILLGLPFFSIVFFFLILSFDMNRQITTTNAFALLTQMSIGFYVAAAASLLLLCSYSRREALNLGSSR